MISIARAAGEWASSHHPGRLLSRDLEDVLRRAGRFLVKDCELWQGGGDGRVLHILTNAAEVGGHTRLVDRWMRFDAKREHSIILTEQVKERVPDWLMAHAAGGVTTLQADTRSEAVRELCGRMAGFDYVVLHVRPYDSVAVAACADPNRRPPTILVNWSDHLFWLGVGVMDTVVNLRSAAAEMNRERRGIDDDRSSLLPLPLDPPERELESRAAKQAIGVDPGNLLMVSIAPEWKFTPHFGLDFASMVGRVLEDVPIAQVIVIGADPSESRWIALEDRYPFRARVIAETPNTGTYLEAADIYLDSIPFSSMTSALEGALMGIPSVTFSSDELPYLEARDFGFGSEMLTRFCSEADWIAGIAALLKDGTLRDRYAERSYASITRDHLPDSWRDSVEMVYAEARIRGWAPMREIPMRFERFDLALASFQDVSMHGRSIEALLAAYDLLPRSLT